MSIQQMVIWAYEDAYPAANKRLGLDAASEEPATLLDIADPSRFREFIII